MNLKVLNATSAALALLVSGCGGGGGTDSTPPPPPPPTTPTFSVATGTMTFSAAKPNAASPAPQTLSGSVTGTLSGTLYIVVNARGSAVAGVSNLTMTGTNSGQVTVTPLSPNSVGAGVHTGTLTIMACVNDPTCNTGKLAGSPATVNVTYTVGSSVEKDVVAPYVVAANTTGAIIIRGHGLTSTTSVTLGGQNASSFTVVSESEIHANYPALPAGTYPVSLNGGAINYHASLVSVAPINSATTSLVYPTAPTGVQGIVYDAERAALLVGVRQLQVGSNAILRYAYVNGAWQAPTSVIVPALEDLLLSNDGTEVLAAADTGITEIDPQTLAPGSSTLLSTVPSPSPSLVYSIALANDGNALLTTNAGGPIRSVVYSTSAKTFAVTGAGPRAASAFVGTAGAGGDGSVILILQGGVTTAQPLLAYPASLGIVLPSMVLLESNVNPFAADGGIKPATAPSLSSDGTKIVITGHNDVLPDFFFSQVYDANLNLLGSLPNLTLAVIVRPDGKRAYALQPSGQLLSFDLTATPAGAAYPQVGSGVSVGTVGETETGRIKMAISPDGGTLFIAGAGGVAVLPSPP